MTRPDVAEHDRDVALGVDLKEVPHRRTASPARGVLDALDPRRPSPELLAGPWNVGVREAIGDAIREFHAQVAELFPIRDLVSGLPPIDTARQEWRPSGGRPVDEDRVVGYHALAAAFIARDDAPSTLLKHPGRSPIPVILLARLGVDLSAQGKGLGAALVKDAMFRGYQASAAIGARALLIHAESERARDFYLHLAEFDRSPSDPLHLILLMSEIERIVARS